ncbi:flagellar basal body-associated FliL family protein [Candidatus Puniceispirillum sp.]|uniref:flagellar basal body-associated FliL family protein n=1 Tax=Candidatus Puniceispirillum sp. TaxID=2026719 RepID=UPI001EB9292D|nr:flagellar basal body-associated FliL family protein [Candidatus Puniceispirillum sp.]MBT6565429.1 flagellar basal body-associated FliL family protein [Candidatus Puniceispirillum sp.]
MAENDDEPKKSKGFLIKIILFVVGGFVLIGAGLGGGYMLFGAAQPDPSEQIEEIIERKMQEAEAAEQEALDNETAQRVSKETPEVENFVTIYYEFPGTFTSNLMGSRKMLQVGVGVSTQYDDSIMEMVESHQLALRSVVLGVLSEFGEEDVQGIAGREKLAVAMRDAMNAKLVSLEDFGGVAEVHFTSFVLQ